MKLIYLISLTINAGRLYNSFGEYLMPPPPDHMNLYSPERVQEILKSQINALLNGLKSIGAEVPDREKENKSSDELRSIKLEISRYFAYHFANPENVEKITEKNNMVLKKLIEPVWSIYSKYLMDINTMNRALAKMKMPTVEVASVVTAMESKEETKELRSQMIETLLGIKSSGENLWSKLEVSPRLQSEVNKVIRGKSITANTRIFDKFTRFYRRRSFDSKKERPPLELPEQGTISEQQVRGKKARPLIS
eukprot:NODE_50_length_27150_cov_0.307308.p11 type:complete len:251 gc:universal NODE_50_length_27150_cov_0.307308:5175-5927(+)